MYTIVRYNESYFKQWNDFLEASKNGTFLFNRNFMEYHADRFEDFSVLVFEGNKLTALLPAHSRENEIYCHWGLTYGELVLSAEIGFEKVKAIFFTVLHSFDTLGFKKIYFKCIPQFYFKRPSFEFDFIYFMLKANLIRKDINLVLDYKVPLNISASKLKNYRKRKGIGFRVEKGNDFESFWNVLIDVLEKKHGAKPIHSLDQIKLLHTRFPENIIQYTIFLEDTILAGITLFIFDNVIKSQYGAATAQGESLRALDFLFISIIEEYKESKSFFDMGTVMNNMGYNKGLLKQKEELGCNVYSQNFYEVETANFVLLENYS